MTEADLRYLESLAGTVRKNLRWAVLLLAAMALILIIDLQLKRSVARLAVTSAERCDHADSVCGRVDQMIADFGKRTYEREPVAENGGDTGSSSGDAGHALVGNTGVAAGSGQEAGPASPAPSRRPAGQGKRAPGNGRRAGGPSA